MWIQNIEQTNIITHLPVFYKQFSCDKKLQKCVLRISALGVFHIKINGHAIEDYFMPGWTNYKKYAHICNYDITPFIKAENLLEITLADGWYCGRLGYTTKANTYGTKPALFAECIFDYEDGTQTTLQTDESWRVGNSPIVNSSFLDGETVDFTTPIFDIADLENLPFAMAREENVPFVEYDYDPVRKIDTLSPTVLYQDEKIIRLDF